MYYLITGIDRKGKRFSKRTAIKAYALAHNVYRGTLWAVDGKGKRKKIHSWYN